MQIILSSTSSARKKLLQRLQLEFSTAAPDIDETPLANETISNLVKRLAQAKAKKIATEHPNSLIIGSDQAVELKGKIFGKPQDKAMAQEQLQMMSGQAVNFITGLCVLNTANQQLQLAVEPFTVVFKQLTSSQIEHYLESENPYACAGSFKSEGLGIALCERFIGRDPSALEGLPLIQLCKLLTNQGVSVI